MNTSLFLAISLSSMLPVTELRATIPIFLSCANPPSWFPLWLSEFLTSLSSSCTDASTWFIFTAAVIGNMIPNFFLLWLLPRLTNWLHDHVAPRINSTVLAMHDFFIKKNRVHLIYSLVSVLTILPLLGLYVLKVHSSIWYIAVLFAVPLWSYIIFLISRKAYQAALEEKSIIHWFYNKVHKEHSEKFYRWGSIALVAIVGIPVPGTGSWTGSILAFLFNIPYWKALGLIFIGILISGTIVTGISTGILNNFGLF